METQDEGKKGNFLSRRKFLKLGLEVTASTILVAATETVFLENTKTSTELDKIIDSFSEIETASNAHWKFHTQKVRLLFENSMQNKLPDCLSGVGFTTSNPDGSSMHVTKIGDEIAATSKYFDNQKGKWIEEPTDLDAFRGAFNDSLFIEAAYKTNEYNVDTKSEALKKLSEESKMELTDQVYKLHSLRLKREFVQDLGVTVANRGVFDSYFFINSPDNLVFSAYQESFPNGFTSEQLQPHSFSLNKNGSPLYTVSESTLSESEAVLRQAANELISGK